VAAWVRGCASGGALSCAKHFPGHGRTVADSHAERPSVGASAAELEADLLPFRASIAAGVDSLMTAHVAYPALDPERRPATLSPPILGPLLRGEMGFGGLVVTDAIIMEGLTEGGSEADASVQALAAGCDVLLYPDDPEAVVRAIEAALADGRLPRARVEDALARTAAAAARVAGPFAGTCGAEEDRRWALETAVRSLAVVRGEPRLPAGPVRLEVVEDDLGGPWPPYPRDAFPAALRAAGVELDGRRGRRWWRCTPTSAPGRGAPASRRGRASGCAELLAEAPGATVVLFSHPRLAGELPAARNLLGAWGGEALMQEAAAAWLTGIRGGSARVDAAGLDR
jgi:hypothetical protein